MSRSSWKVVDTGIMSAAQNMAHDVSLLNELEASSERAILHLYEWKLPSATYGHFIDPNVYLTKEAFLLLDLAKRPTGGGIIFHTTDWAFSMLIPAGHEAYSINTLDNYAFVNHLVIEAISHFSGREANLSLLPNHLQGVDKHSAHFCMAKPTKYDVMLGGKKVGGGAQRRTKNGYLHQGTISLALPDRDLLNKVLQPDTCVYEAMLKNTSTLLPFNSTSRDLAEATKLIRESFLSIVA